MPANGEIEVPVQAEGVDGAADEVEGGDRGGVGLGVSGRGGSGGGEFQNSDGQPYDVFDLDDCSCDATVRRDVQEVPEGVALLEMNRLPAVENCTFRPFVAVKDFEGGWIQFCRIHARPDWLDTLKQGEVRDSSEREAV